MNPVVPTIPPPGQAAHLAEVAEISSYFGGTPRTAPAGEAAAEAPGNPDTAALIATARRRGC
jgi:hypothetical protein